jgi:hypothetical protein
MRWGAYHAFAPWVIFIGEVGGENLCVSPYLVFKLQNNPWPLYLGLFTRTCRTKRSLTLNNSLLATSYRRTDQLYEIK